MFFFECLYKMCCIVYNLYIKKYILIDTHIFNHFQFEPFNSYSLLLLLNNRINYYNHQDSRRLKL